MSRTSELSTSGSASLSGDRSSAAAGGGGIDRSCSPCAAAEGSSSSATNDSGGGGVALRALPPDSDEMQEELRNLQMNQLSVTLTPHESGEKESPEATVRRNSSLSSSTTSSSTNSSGGGGGNTIHAGAKSPMASIFSPPLHNYTASSGADGSRPSSPQPHEDGAASSASTGDAHMLASFRPPSPNNVVHVLGRHRVTAEDNPLVGQLQQALDHQGEMLVDFRMPAEIAAAACKLQLQARLPIVPQLLSFLHLFHEAPSSGSASKNHSRRGSRSNSHDLSASKSDAKKGSAGTPSGAPLHAASPSPITPNTATTASSAHTISEPQSLSRSGSGSVSAGGSHSSSSSNSNSHQHHHHHTNNTSNASSPPASSPHSLEVPRSLDSPLATPSLIAAATPSVHNRASFDLSLSDNEMLLRDLLREYVDIFWENPRAFAAFYKKRNADMTLKEKADLIYHHLKGRESGNGSSIDPGVKKQIEKAKPRLLTYIEDLLGVRSLALASVVPQLVNSGSYCVIALSMMQEAGPKYLAAVNVTLGRLREQFLAVRTQVDARLSESVLQQLSALPSYDELNLRVLQAVFEPELQAQIASYHQAYRQAAGGLPGRILLSTLLRNRVESRTHLDDITFQDLIIAVEESTGHLRKALHSLMRVHPELFQAVLDGALPSQQRLQPVTPEFSQSLQKLGDIYKIALLGFLRASRIYPKLTSPATFKLSRRLQLRDVVTFRLLTESRYQEALWRLHDVGAEAQADALESWLHKRLLNDAHIVAVENLGGGFTTTKLMTLQADDSEIPGLTSHSGLVRGVYKPKTKASLLNLQSLKDALVSNHRKEIAAYRVDKLLRLFHVPLTKNLLYEEREGSLQLFVTNAVAARAVQALDLDKPKAPGKFSAPKGRSELPRRIRLFDFLIDNRDRNLDNYLISSIDQRVVLIDHGSARSDVCASWTFTTPKSVNEVHRYHDAVFLRSLIPHRAMFSRVRWLASPPGHAALDEQLKFLLSSDDLNALKHRLSLFVKFVDDEIKRIGEDAVFQLPDQEDRRCLCDKDAPAAGSSVSNNTHGSGNGSGPTAGVHVGSGSQSAHAS